MHLVALIIEVGSFRAWFFPLTQKHQFLGSGKGLARVCQGFGEGLAKVLARFWQGSGDGPARVLARVCLARVRRGSGEGRAKNNGKTKVQITSRKPRYRSRKSMKIQGTDQIDLCLRFSIEIENI